ncbi:MAG: transglutaminase family protein [Magnetococcales bacterium]|nr:transglutaminase family protein [Magnetococcales bacterium]
MDYRIAHITRYRYGEPVTICHNRVLLAPLTLPWQQCRQFELAVNPRPALVQSFGDYFGNTVHYFEIHEPHQELVVRANSLVTCTPPQHPDPAASCAWDNPCPPPPDLAAGLRLNRLFVLDSPMVYRSRTLADLARQDFTPGRPLVEAALAFTRRIHGTFRFQPGSTSVATPVEQVLEQQRGVCQDFAHLALGALRSLGLCARYVSGYLETDPPPGQPRLEGADASHAWFSLQVPGLGWVDFDPTNGLMPGPRHITVAVGRDYGDVAPVKGVVLGGREHVLTVSVDVARTEH